MITLDTCYAAMDTYGFTPSEIRSCWVSTIRAGRDSPALVKWVNKMVNEANIAYSRGDPEAWTEHWKLPDWETYFAVKAQASLRADAAFIDQDETVHESEEVRVKAKFAEWSNAWSEAWGHVGTKWQKFKYGVLCALVCP